MAATRTAGVEIEVAARLSVLKVQLPGSVRRFLREKLFIMNSEYIIKQRLGKATYDTPKFFDLIEESPPYLRLPRGFLGQLTGFLDAEQIAYTIRYYYPSFLACNYVSSIQLRSEQTQVVDQAFAAGQGVIVAPPGSGKTMMGLELIARHGQPVLILTHRKQLLDQWVEHLQTYFGMPKKQIGRYSSTAKKIGDQVTVGLLQSFARSKDLAALRDRFGVIIVDECHHIPAATFRAVIAQLNAPHIYGLTATPKRKHNDERLIYLYIGDIVATLGATPIVTTPEAPADGFQIAIHDTTLALPFDWKTDQFELLAKVICYDTARNEQLVRDILEQVALQRKTLVLSERKEHLKVLELYLRGHCQTLIFSGDDSLARRAAKLQQIKDGSYDVLLATGQIFGEGIHVDTIASLVLAFPFAFEGKLAQYVGRLSHSSRARQLIDYRDSNVAVLEKQYKQRQRYYNKLQKL
jgi:superfamily II DNA or RNA helicase